MAELQKAFSLQESFRQYYCHRRTYKGLVIEELWKQKKGYRKSSSKRRLSKELQKACNPQKIFYPQKTADNILYAYLFLPFTTKRPSVFERDSEGIISRVKLQKIVWLWKVFYQTSIHRKVSKCQIAVYASQKLLKLQESFKPLLPMVELQNVF